MTSPRRDSVPEARSGVGTRRHVEVSTHAAWGRRRGDSRGRGRYLVFLGGAGPLGRPGAKFQSTGLSSCCVFLRVQ